MITKTSEGPPSYNSEVEQWVEGQEKSQASPRQIDEASELEMGHRILSSSSNPEIFRQTSSPTNPFSPTTPTAILGPTPAAAFVPMTQAEKEKEKEVESGPLANIGKALLIIFLGPFVLTGILSMGIGKVFHSFGVLLTGGRYANMFNTL
ncbi:hypothetical protein C8J56DRAFT_937307 [Mycena floridula]|nr:hypothetical protein C8J56DRAFT_937307 [Mycena floridula]